ncbi:GRP family sugar transporter [Caviibacter abscessus]|uniref:GRP family sugar transporter n=1 Tax=Caviibacter abscessus TaxID=1766719 RepID=UPI000833E4F8|nr:GRP family sugar transporter [Caviibacter abscessus]
MYYILAFLPALCWGLIAIVISIFKIDTKKQVFAVAFGAFLLSLVFITKVTKLSFLAGITSGLFWVLGFYYQTKCLKKIGISRIIPPSTAMQIFGTTIIGILVFREKVNVYLVIICILALIIGVNLAVYKQKKENINKIDKYIIIDLIISTIGFVVYATVIKYFKVDAKSSILPQTMGMVLGSLYLNKNNLKDLLSIKVVQNMLAGILWFVGNISMFLSSEVLGITVAFAISQLNVAVSVSSAIIILKEHKTKKELIYISIGIILIILSGIFISRA